MGVAAAGVLAGGLAVAVGGAALFRQASMRAMIAESAPRDTRFWRSRAVGVNEMQLRCTSCAICAVVMDPALR